MRVFMGSSMHIPKANPDQRLDADGLAAFLCCAAFLLLVWVLLTAMPAVIAWSRGHPNAMAITALTVFLGWTFYGWVAALVWSLWYIPREPVLREERRDSIYDVLEDEYGPPPLPRPSDAIWRKG